MNNDNPYENVSVEINYVRPYFDCPNLKGPDGNAFNLFQKACSTLKENGFKVEATELNNLMTRFKYEEHFNNIAHYLDFKESKEVLDEDEEFIVVKVKKTSFSYEDNIKQINFFNYPLNDIQFLRGLMNAEDFSISNCYGRNILYYAQEPEVVDFLIQQNKIHNWFDIFDIDNLYTPLLTSKTNLDSFALILQEYHNEIPELAERFLTASNKVGNIALNSIAPAIFKIVDHSLEHLSINEKNYQSLVNVLSVIDKVSPSSLADIKSNIYSALNKGMKQKVDYSELKTQYEHLFLSVKLNAIPASNTISKSIKI